jgi:hypothetical protein
MPSVRVMQPEPKRPETVAPQSTDKPATVSFDKVGNADSQDRPAAAKLVLRQPVQAATQAVVSRPDHRPLFRGNS